MKAVSVKDRVIRKPVRAISAVIILKAFSVSLYRSKVEVL